MNITDLRNSARRKIGSSVRWSRRQLLEAKNNRIFIKSSAQKVVAVANERWSLTRCSNYSDLIGKLLLCGKGVA